MRAMPIGTKFTTHTVVRSGVNTAATLGSGTLEVFATPAMIGQMEMAAEQATAPFLEEGESTVGTMVNITHDAASPVGMEISATAELIAQNGRELIFQIVAEDAVGIIGKGEHKRFVIDIERFMTKAQNRG